VDHVTDGAIVAASFGSGTLATPADIADAVHDEALSGHTVPGTAGKVLSDVLEDTGTTLPATLADILEDTGTTLPAQITLGVTTGTVVDGAPGATTFITSLTSAVTDFYAGNVLAFTDGALKTQARRILSYNGSTKAVTLESALTAAPANGAAFIILGRIEE
jgi:hypothetical protein